MKKEKSKSTSQLPTGPRRLTSVIIMLVIITGIASALFAGITVDLRGRDYLRGRAQTIADTLPAESISFLDGEANDADKFEYRELKALLERIKANNPDLNYVYLMRQRGVDIVFLVDATDPSQAELFSPPGEIYVEATEQLFSGFSGNQPFVEGPSRDRWGLWLSALAPVTDPSSGQVVAWVGIDTPALNYYFEVAIYALVPLCLAAIPLAGLLRDRKLEHKQWEITQLKQQFVSIASHELRSPLTGMVWAIQSLLKQSENMTEEQKQLLHDMFQSAQASTATINEILDLTVFERRQADNLHRDDVELVTAIQEVHKTLNLGAQEKRLTIEMEHFPESAHTVGDLSAIKRAFMNILSNSVKYSFEGSTITIGYRRDGAQHVMSIRDHGIGIPASELEKVLEGYHRATNAVKVQAKGTGLGLWITRLVIEEHGGKLWLTSEENKGTTVFIALPATEATAPVTK